MLRILGRCVLVVLIVSCGGLIVNLKRPHLESSGKEPDIAEILDDPSLQVRYYIWYITNIKSIINRCLI